MCRFIERDFSDGSKMQDFMLVELLKICTKQKDLSKGSRMHAEILKKGLLERSSYIASSLINMYVKCGVLEKAEQVLEGLSVRDIVSWNALVAGYALHGQGYGALGCLKRMQSEGLNPDSITFIGVLKACGNIGAIAKGKQIHEAIMNRGLLEKNIILGNALVDMYAKCGLLEKALQVLEELPIRNVASWSALIAGYAQMGQGHKALHCFDRMLREGLLATEVTFTSVLKACSSIGAIDKGKQIHDEIINQGFLNKSVALGNALVAMYGRCGDLTTACQVLRELCTRNVVSWSALIAGYAENQQGHEALNCFTQMQREGLSPNEVTYTSILKACGSMRDVDNGKQIHKEIVSRGMLKEENIVLGTTLLDMYAKCSLLLEARKVFQDLPKRDIVSWSTIIAAHVQEGQGHEALSYFAQMQKDMLSPDDVTFISVLKGCAIVGALDEGKRIHNEIGSKVSLRKNIALGNALIDMYAKCGMLVKAQQVLEELHFRDVVSWNTLIAEYVKQSQYHAAFDCFLGMQKDGLFPDEVTFTCLLNSCSISGTMNNSMDIHEEIANYGLLERNVMLVNALLHMYVQEGNNHKALNYFDRMQMAGVSPDEVTFTCISKACGNIGILDRGQQIHNEIVHRGLLEKDVFLGNTLVDMYVKCGVVAKAQQVLEELPVRDVVSWNALIAGYAKQMQGHQALACFTRMLKDGHSPNEITYTCILMACGSIGAIGEGQRIHCEIINRRLLEKGIAIGTALVDMYAKCGMFAKARQLLTELPLRNVTTWNALISGYAQEGHYDETVACFKQMQNEGVSPTGVTFLCVLNACCHSGKFSEAQMYYETMSKYKIVPDLEHNTCMIVVFGSAGRLDKAMSVIKTMPCCNDASVWLALLGACKKWGNVELGRLAFDQAVRLDKSLVASYAFMIDIYAAAGMQEKAQEVRDMKLTNSKRNFEMGDPTCLAKRTQNMHKANTV